MILLIFICLVLWLVWTLYRIFGYRYRSFAGRVVLVTGACSEVGRRLCVQLHTEGASVIAWDYSKIKLDELRHEIITGGGGGGGGVSSFTSSASADAAAALSTTSASGSGGGYSRGSPASAAFSNRGAAASSPAPAGSTSSPVGSGLSPASSNLNSNAVGGGGGCGVRRQSSGSNNINSHRAFFEVAMVDVSSRLQVQRAAKDLLAILPGLTGSNSSNHVACVDVILNASHAGPGRPLADRSEDTIERMNAVNAVAPLLLARLLCPLMMERREGGQFVTFTSSFGGYRTRGGAYSRGTGASAIGLSSRGGGSADGEGTTAAAVELSGGLFDADSPDYAASQWGATGAHHSVTAWLRRLRGQERLPGEVRTTLVAMDAMQVTSTAYASPAGRSRSGSPYRGATSPATSTPSATADNDGVAAASKDGTGTGGSGGRSDAPSPALAMDRLVQRCLRAIGRGEESFTDAYGAALTPLVMVLPAPWMTAVLRLVSRRRRRHRDGAKVK